MAADYDPFARGPRGVAVVAIETRDAARDLTLPGAVWHPVPSPDAAPRCPVVLFSHRSGGFARMSSFLCEHLASHGYVVAAVTHAETVDPALAPKDGETADERETRIDAVVARRVPDLRRLLDAVLAGGAVPDGVVVDPERIGLVGHSFGGWTVLAAPDVDPRPRSLVALAPGGAAQPRPGVLPLRLAFQWGRPVPTLVLAGTDDVLTALDGIRELFGRMPAPKRLVALGGADHSHFVDDIAGDHETLRTSDLPGESAWIPAAMRPIGELCPPQQAHLFTRGLTLAHFDATLRGSAAARDLLERDVAGALAERGVPVLVG